MSEKKYLNTGKRAKLIVSGFKDSADRGTEELLESGTQSFTVQYIVLFSMCVRNWCVNKASVAQKCFPVPLNDGKLESCLFAVCLQRLDPRKRGAPMGAPSSSHQDQG